MKLNIEDIVVDDRIRQTVGNIDELALDLRVNGQIVPITVRVANDGTYHLVAGYRRITAMRLNGEKTIEAFVIPEDDEETLLRMEISENEVREDFTKSERASYMRKLLELEQKKAKERQNLGLKSDEGGRADEETAKQFGIGKDTMRKELQIVEHKDEIDPEIFKNWDDGKLSTNKIYTELKAKLKAKEEELTSALEGNRKLASTNKELEKESLRWKNAWQTQELPEATVEEIEDLKGQIEAYRHSEEILRSDNKKLVEDRNKWEQLYKESGRVEPTLDEKAQKDMDWLTMGIYTFLQQYGAKGWAIDRRESIPHNKTEELRKQAKNLLAFAQNLYEMTKGEEE